MMSTAKSRKKFDTGYRRRENDWRLFLRLLPYARRRRRSLALAILLLVPIAFANAVQPLLIGQLISLIRTEPSTYEFLRNRPLLQGLNIIEVLLLITISIRLTLTGFQGYLVQKLGQQITAEIRRDLFHHVTSLAVRFFDRTPVGKLITRLTSDVEVLGDVFSTGAVGIVSDLFLMLVILGFMFSIQWQLAFFATDGSHPSDRSYSLLTETVPQSELQNKGRTFWTEFSVTRKHYWHERCAIVPTGKIQCRVVSC